MTTDALDPGPDGTFPYWPREGDETRMPTGTSIHLDVHGRTWNVDLTPTDGDGVPIVPPA
jgi:hypothetical protein